MKRTLIALFCLGLVIGAVQLLFVRTKTQQHVQRINTGNIVTCQAVSPECGNCLYEVRNGYCYEPPYKQKFRGFPFSSGSYGFDSRINITPKLIGNVLIWALGLPLIGYFGITAKYKISKK